jgi:hypothetical protein
MGELSTQLLQGRLPLLPAWPGYQEAVDGRLQAVRSAIQYYRSLTEAQRAMLSRARKYDVFLRVEGACRMASDCPSAAGDDPVEPLESWLEWLVDRHDGVLRWAVDAANHMTMGPGWYRKPHPYGAY